MLHLFTDVTIDALELTPTPQNILNEFDSITYPLGVKRYKGEKTYDFKHYAYKTNNVLINNQEAVDLLTGLEGRSEISYLVFESNNIFDVVVTANKLLEIKVYDPGKYGDIYYQSYYSFDLYDRATYPFMEELVAAINVQIPEIRAYITPFTTNRRNDIIPESLCVFRNLNIESSPAMKASTFYGIHRRIIPDSVRINKGLFETRISLVGTSSHVLSDSQVYIDFLNGKYTCNKDLSTYGVTFSYRLSPKVLYLPITNSFSICDISDPNIATQIDRKSIVNNNSHSVLIRRSNAENFSIDTHSGQHPSNLLARINLPQRKDKWN